MRTSGIPTTLTIPIVKFIAKYYAITDVSHKSFSRVHIGIGDLHPDADPNKMITGLRKYCDREGITVYTTTPNTLILAKTPAARALR